MYGLAWLLVTCTTIVPGLVLILSSLTRQTNDFASGLTLHYWTGGSDPALAQGQPGIVSFSAVNDQACS